ncbi:hypothetical protein HDE_06667 [Halotydeus destructor]|nr:hypothetical protein HDE_06667 [Halotydeus destructor]
MMFSYKLLLLVTALILHAEAAHYEIGINGKEYHVSDDLRTFQLAQTHCEKNGGRMAEILDQDEYLFIKQHILKKNSKTVWLGAQGTSDHHYKWMSGKKSTSEITKTRWHQLQPNCKNDTCCGLLLRSDSLFGDDPCDSKFNVLCEKHHHLDQNVTAAPSVEVNSDNMPGKYKAWLTALTAGLIGVTTVVFLLTAYVFYYGRHSPRKYDVGMSLISDEI